MKTLREDDHSTLARWVGSRCVAGVAGSDRAHQDSLCMSRVSSTLSSNIQHQLGGVHK